MTWREELAWAAGFFDGEGNFGARLNNVRRGKGAYWTVQLRITQHHPEVLHRFRAAVKGVGKVYGPYERPYKDRTTTKWVYAAYGWDAHAVAAMIFSFLGTVKRTQIKSGMKTFFDDLPNRKRAPIGLYTRTERQRRRRARKNANY